MRSIDTAVRSVLLAGVMAIYASSAVAATPPAPPPPAPPKHKPYASPAQNSVTDAYEYRTRIQMGKPGCQRFATDADVVFLDEKMDDAAKADRLKAIGASAAAAGCLAP